MEAQPRPPVPATYFVPNQEIIRDTRGLLRPDILYYADIPGGRILARRGGFSWVLSSNDSTGGLRLDFDLIDPSASLQLIPDRATGPPIYRYHSSTTPRILSSTQRLRWRNIYPNIDLILDVSANQFKYDFIVHPGGIVGDIRFRYAGAESVHRASDGGIVVQTSLGPLIEQPPVSFQSKGHPTTVDQMLPSEGCDSVGTSFHHDNGVISFSVARYDSSRILVIDPALRWGTYFGGALWDYSYGSLGGIGGWDGAPRWASLHQGMAIDRDGNYYVCGASFSSDFPLTPGAFQGQLNGESDAVIMSFNTYGDLRWSTYFGGSRRDYATALAVDRDGTVAVVGTTGSTDLPVALDPLQKDLAGGSGDDMFVARFDAGGRYLWSTYLGGTGQEEAAGCGIDSRGDVVVAGATTSTNFPVTLNAQQGGNNGLRDLVVVAITATGRLHWSTYLGGSMDEFGGYLAVDAGDNVVLCGTSFSRDFPTVLNVDQPNFAPSSSPGTFDCVLASFDTGGLKNWATYFGGSSFDWSAGVAVDRSDNSIILTGSTSSIDLPLGTKPLQSRLGRDGTSDIFVARYTDRGRRLWSTYYGGSEEDYSAGVALSPTGTVAILGSTTSRDLLRSNDRFQWFLDSLADICILELDRDGGLIWDSYFGGNGNDWGAGILVDGGGSIVINGITSSTNLVVRNPVQRSLNTDSVQIALFPDIVVASFCNKLTPSFLPEGNLVLCEGDSLVLTAPAGYRYLWSPGGETTRSITVRQPGDVSLVLIGSDECYGYSSNRTVKSYPHPDPPSILSDRTPEICQGDSVTLRAMPPNLGGTIRWSTGATTPTITVGATGSYSLYFIDSIGCSSVSAPLLVEVHPNPPRPDISPSDTLWLCAGDSSLLLDAGMDQGIAFIWSDGSASRSIYAPAGTYWLRVRSAFGCLSEADTVVVALAPPIPPIVAIPTGSLSLCDGDSIRLDAPPGFKGYLWSNGDSTPSITVRTTGSYQLTVTDSFGCRATTPTVDVRVHQNPFPRIIPAGPLLLSDGDSVALAVVGAYSAYRWSNGDSTGGLLVRDSGSYRVWVVDSNGCSGESNIVVVQRPDSFAVAVTIVDRVGFPGERVEIPIRVDPAVDLYDEGVRGFSATLRFDRTLLLPIEGTPLGRLESGDRVIDIVGGVTKNSVAGDLYTLVFTAVLGRTASTPIAFDRFVWQGGRMATTLHGGEFRLDGYCTNDGGRFAAETGATLLRPVRPNPTFGGCVVEWQCSEDGPVTLAVVNMLGEEVALLLREELPAGMHRRDVDLSGLPEGGYLLRLQTRTERALQTVVILR